MRLASYFTFGIVFPVGFLAVVVLGVVPLQAADPLDPAGQIHMPIGIANSLDTLKTFVEGEGCFWPGFGSYGIYFWVFDPEAGKLFAPPAGKCERGLAEIETAHSFGTSDGRCGPGRRKAGYQTVNNHLDSPAKRTCV
jgi:hypothetical protein